MATASAPISSSAPLISISNGVITGGTYTQIHKHTHNDRHVILQSSKSGFDRLQEVVAPGAFHNSSERFDPPKCHPNTRVEVMKRISDWILGRKPELRSVSIMWLNGAAGAGKSAIAQSLAESCVAEGSLVASFFFGRSDPNRNHARTLFPTIAYQIAVAFPSLHRTLSSIIDNDPLIFSRNLAFQFRSLIVEPLNDLSRMGHFSGNPSSPCLIIIDGLDECLDRDAQRQILDIIIDGINIHNLPLIFFIASRPEHDISCRFNLPDTQNILTRLFLDDRYLPDIDIELFLRDKFRNISETHPFKKSIPSPWPTDDVIRHLIRKSSGQFIYASTIVKYVGSSRHQPHHRLKIIQKLRPAASEHPFAELDALYMHIFSRVDDIELIPQIIAFEMLYGGADTKDIENILVLEPGAIEVLLCDLSSIIAVTTPLKSGPSGIKILHASLPDFLLDHFRSYGFRIDLDLERTSITRKCIQFLSREPFTAESMSEAHGLAMLFFQSHGKECLYSVDVQDDLYAISIPRWYQQMSVTTTISPSNPIYYFNFEMLGYFLRTLHSSTSEGTKRLFSHHLHAFHAVLSRHLQLYFSDSRLNLLVTLLDFAIENYSDRHMVFYPDFLLFEVDINLLRIDSTRLGLLSGYTMKQPPSYWSFPSIVHRYLTDPKNSEKNGLNGARFAEAAICCLNYLSDSSRGPTTALHDHCQEFKTLIRKQNSVLDKFFDGDPDSWRQKFSMAVEYLQFFLQRADPSDRLIDSCRHASFLKLSGLSPNDGEVARKAVLECSQWIRE